MKTLLNCLKRNFWTLLLLALLYGCVNPKKDKNAETNEDKPNIVFFIADDMYLDMFNCLPDGQGKNLTPNLDRLAAEGVVMNNQFVASPVSSPSRYNCLTGTYASRASNKAFHADTKKHEGQTVIQWNTFITPENTTLPNYLQELGYKTGMVGKSHVIEVDSLHTFEDFWADAKDPQNEQWLEDNYQRTLKAVKKSGFDYAGSIYFDNPNWVGLGELAVQNMEWITAAGLEFIEENSDDPFFLYFATTIPHQPSEPERSWQADPLKTARGYLEEAPDVQPPRHTLPERIKEAGLEGQNKELILWLDDALGALIDKLEEKGELDNTVIIFFSDHGQKAKGTLYQDGVLSPSIIWKAGGFACGNSSDAPVQNIDFAPTILDLAGGTDLEKKFDGKSMKPILEGTETASDRVFYFELGFARAVVKGDFKYLAVRYPETANNMSPAERKAFLKKYNDTRRERNMQIVNYDPAAPFSHFSVVPGGQQAEHESYGTRPGYFEADQLYNISDDPKEMNNLVDQPEYQEKLKELQEELQKYLDELPGEFGL